MAIETKKVFRQDIVGADILGTDPGYGSVEICVNGCPQVSLKDKAAFLQNLESCLREAYIWTAAQIGTVDENAVEKPQNSGACAGAVLRDVLNRFYDSPALTHEEIKSILARKYGTAQAACQDLHDRAWEELVERDDVEAYRFNCERAQDMLHYAGGIQTAAEALGVGKDELAEIAAAIREERKL